MKNHVTGNVICQICLHPSDYISLLFHVLKYLCISKLKKLMTDRYNS